LIKDKRKIGKYERNGKNRKDEGKWKGGLLR
jgi:hypothetical protein